MQQLHAVLFASTAKGQDLTIVIEFHTVGRCVQVHDGFNGILAVSRIQVDDTTFGTDCQVFKRSG